jgi:putative flippase GtrA
MRSQAISTRALRFLAAGVPITLCDYAAFAVFVRLGLDPAWARAASFAVAFVAAFFLHRRWTFGSTFAWTRDLAAFAGARLACFLLAQLAFVFLHQGLGLGPDLAFWLQAPVQPLGNFLAGHFLVFRAPPRA